MVWFLTAPIDWNQVNLVLDLLTQVTLVDTTIRTAGGTKEPYCFNCGSMSGERLATDAYATCLHRFFCFCSSCPVKVTWKSMC